MFDKSIITQKELNYIETLYLQCNLHEFITEKLSYNDWLLGEVNERTGERFTQKDIDDSYDYDRHGLMLEYLEDTLLHSAEKLGLSSGRSWYKMKNYRIGIMSYDKAKKSNQYTVIIQYEWEHLYSLEPSLKGLDLPFDGNLNQYHFKRIDVTKMFKTEYDYLTNKGFICTFRKQHIEKNGDVVETVYLGHRSNGSVYRMYNKTVELKTDTAKHPINHKKIELLSKYFGDIEDLYTFELELHRSYLKEQLNITTLDQLEQVYTAYSSIVGKIRIYEDTDYNKSLIKQNNRKRIEAFTITPYKEYKKVYRAKYKSSKEYLYDVLYKKITAYEKQNKDVGEFELIEGMIERKTQNILEISVSHIEPTLEKEDPMELIEKFERLRGGTDHLQSEAYNAFKPYVFNDPNQIF